MTISVAAGGIPPPGALLGDYLVHGLIADPTVTGRAIDYIDGEKVYVEICAVAFVAVAVWRIQHRRARRRTEMARA